VSAASILFLAPYSAKLVSDHQAASNAWGSFAIFLGTAGRLGNLFLGLWVLAAG
jgi:hypothetical protein